MRRAAFAAVSWLLAGFGAVAIITGVLAVGAVGGYCASGGPFIPRVECPENAGAAILLGAVSFAAAVIINIALARGFGPDLPALGIPLLFAILGALFLGGAFTPGELRLDLAIPGIAMVAMAVGFAFLARDGGLARMLVGSRFPSGEETVDHRRPQPVFHRGLPRPADGRRLRPGQSLLLALCGMVPLAVGVLVGLLLS